MKIILESFIVGAELFHADDILRTDVINAILIAVSTTLIAVSTTLIVVSTTLIVVSTTLIAVFASIVAVPTIQIRIIEPVHEAIPGKSKVGFTDLVNLRGELLVGDRRGRYLHDPRYNTVQAVPDDDGFLTAGKDHVLPVQKLLGASELLPANPANAVGEHIDVPGEVLGLNGAGLELVQCKRHIVHGRRRALESNSSGVVTDHQAFRIAPYGDGRLFRRRLSRPTILPQMEIDDAVLQRLQQYRCEACRQHSPCKWHGAQLYGHIEPYGLAAFRENGLHQSGRLCRFVLENHLVLHVVRVELLQPVDPTKTVYGAVVGDDISIGFLESRQELH